MWISKKSFIYSPSQIIGLIPAHRSTFTLAASISSAKDQRHRKASTSISRPMARSAKDIAII